MHTHPKNDNCISSFMTTKKFDAIVEIAGKVDANYAAQIEGYCSLLVECGKKFETVCAMLALDLIGVKVFRYSDETAEAVASGEKLLKESGTIYESFADMMSPEDAKRYLDFLENGSREGLTSAELAGVEKADALLVSQEVEYDDVWDLRNPCDVLESGTSSELKVIGTYDNNNYFTRAVEFNAGSEGTGFTYKVYQRNDIDWNMVRTTGAKKGRGLTNAQAAEKYGLAPILNDGYVVTLHHSQQRSVGPLFEASTRYHNISNAKKGPLHPYKGQLNPFNPMDSNTRGLFQKVDSIEYWKARGRDAMKGVQ